jgi:hypothetical protein
VVLVTFEKRLHEERLTKIIVNAPLIPGVHHLHLFLPIGIVPLHELFSRPKRNGILVVLPVLLNLFYGSYIDISTCFSIFLILSGFFLERSTSIWISSSRYSL